MSDSVFVTSSANVTCDSSTTIDSSLVTEETVTQNVDTPPIDFPDKNVLSAVLQICRKYNLKVCHILLLS